MWYAAFIVVVVDDGTLMIAEVFLRPGNREFSETGKVDAVLGVGRDDVMLIGACGFVPPRPVVVEFMACLVHHLPPREDVARQSLIGNFKIQIVACQSPSVLR